MSASILHLSIYFVHVSNWWHQCLTNGASSSGTSQNLFRGVRRSFYYGVEFLIKGKEKERGGEKRGENRSLGAPPRILHDSTRPKRLIVYRYDKKVKNQCYRYVYRRLLKLYQSILIVIITLYRLFSVWSFRFAALNTSLSFSSFSFRTCNVRTMILHVGHDRWFYWKSIRIPLVSNILVLYTTCRSSITFSC